MRSTRINERLSIAVALAREAGQFVLSHRRKCGSKGLRVEHKSRQDFVTDMDRWSEDVVRTGLSKEFPSDGFLGEETPGTIGEHATWVVDPIDGTTNYIRGFDHWGVSIALVVECSVVAGVVYHPVSDIAYSAVVGEGASANDRPLERPDAMDRSRALAAVGFNHNMDINEHVSLLRTLHGLGCDLRNNGAAAIDLVNVAEGKIDFSFVHILHPWDALAGLLIASEAGAVGYCLPLPEFLHGSGPVLCGDATLVHDAKAMLDVSIDAVSNVSQFNSV